jgi:hypothetical protein
LKGESGSLGRGSEYVVEGARGKACPSESLLQDRNVVTNVARGDRKFSELRHNQYTSLSDKLI